MEQALLKQSQRIVTENIGKEIGKAELLQLKVEDFEVNVAEQYTNLNRLKNVQWDSMTADEKSSWKYGRRLLSFKPGDWVLHKNVPEYGKVTAARLSSEYFYQNPLPSRVRTGGNALKLTKFLLSIVMISAFTLIFTENLK